MLEDPEIVGAITNIGGRHWVSLRKADDAIWLLDSVHTPRQLSTAEYEEFVKKHRHSYPIRRLSV